MDSGNVKIYDYKSKEYLDMLVKTKKSWKSRSSWGYGHENKKGESWLYTDIKSNKGVFESVIYMEIHIKERLPNHVSK